MGIQHAKAGAETRVPGPGWRVTSRWFFSDLEKEALSVTPTGVSTKQDTYQMFRCPTGCACLPVTENLIAWHSLPYIRPVPVSRPAFFRLWTLDLRVSRPDLRLGVGSRISWVIFLSRIRDPTQPLVFSPSRDCWGSFLPIVKKDPHHRRGSFFRSRRGSFPRQRRPPSIRCPDRILNRQLRAPSLCL
jgi:hypothetical protein